MTNWSDATRPPLVHEEDPHAQVVDLLVAKGYLPARYPLTAHEFYPALMAALTAAPCTADEHARLNAQHLEQVIVEIRQAAGYTFDERQLDAIRRVLRIVLP